MHHSDSAHRRSPQAVSPLILDVAGAQHLLLLRFPCPIPKPIIDPTLAPPHHVSRILLHPKCLLLFLRTNVSSTLVSQHSGAFRVLFLLLNLRNHAWLRSSGVLLTSSYKPDEPPATATAALLAGQARSRSQRSRGRCRCNRSSWRRAG